MQQTDILLTIKLQQQLFVDPKRIRLLKEIQQCGSISQAAKNANVSYKSAWDHLEAMNAISPKPLLERNAGGKNGGGTQLTSYADRLLQLYDLLAKTQEKAFEILQDEQIPLDNLLSATAKFSPQSSARNQFFGRVAAIKHDGVLANVAIKIANFPTELTACITQSSQARLQLEQGKEVMLMIKAPWLKLHATKPDAPNAFQAEVLQIVHKGEIYEVALLAGDVACFATAHQEDLPPIGEKVWISIDPEQIVLLAL